MDNGKNNFANAVRVIKHIDDVYAFDFAYTEKKDGPITNDDVSVVAHIITDKEMLKILQKMINGLLEKSDE